MSFRYKLFNDEDRFVKWWDDFLDQANIDNKETLNRYLKNYSLEFEIDETYTRFLTYKNESDLTLFLLKWAY